MIPEREIDGAIAAYTRSAKNAQAAVKRQDEERKARTDKLRETYTLLFTDKVKKLIEVSTIRIYLFCNNGLPGYGRVTIWTGKDGLEVEGINPEQAFAYLESHGITPAIFTRKFDDGVREIIRVITH